MKELIKIQSELKAPKNQYNSFGKYAYRSLEDILAAAKPLLAKYECALNLTDEILLIGNRYYVQATATITNKDGVTRTATACAQEPESKKGMDAAQITGATSSYARKYALNGLLAIDDTKDADATNVGGNATAPTVTKPKTHINDIESDMPADDLTPLVAIVKASNSTDELKAIWAQVQHKTTAHGYIQLRQAITIRNMQLEQK